MTKAEFLQAATEYERQTTHHSFAHMMRKAPAYRTLIAAGAVVVPYIIEELEAHLNGPKSAENDLDLWGMNWVLILMDITHHSPIQPTPVAGGHFVAWDVDDTCKAWIDWHCGKAVFP